MQDIEGKESVCDGERQRERERDGERETEMQWRLKLFGCIVFAAKEKRTWMHVCPQDDCSQWRTQHSIYLINGF